jgi:hypothetical protein
MTFRSDRTARLRALLAVRYPDDPQGFLVAEARWIATGRIDAPPTRMHLVALLCEIEAWQRLAREPQHSEEPF